MTTAIDRGQVVRKGYTFSAAEGFATVTDDGTQRVEFGIARPWVDFVCSVKPYDARRTRKAVYAFPVSHDA